jgi:hypothetical protein
LKYGGVEVQPVRVFQAQQVYSDGVKVFKISQNSEAEESLVTQCVCVDRKIETCRHVFLAKNTIDGVMTLSFAAGARSPHSSAHPPPDFEKLHRKRPQCLEAFLTCP